MSLASNGYELLPYQTKQIRKILTHIKGRKNLHIYGAEGTGKTALLDYVYDNWKKNDTSVIPIYCRTSRTLREIFQRISGFLLNHFRHLESVDKFKRVKEIKYPSDIKKLNMRTLKNLIFSYLPQADFCVIMDHLENVTPKINSFLSPLYERAMVITASRQSWEIADYSFRGRLDYSLYLIPKLRVENLQKKEALSLMQNLYDDAGLGILNKARAFEDIFCVTAGNPKMIAKIFEKAGNPQYLKGHTFNLNLILIDCEMDRIYS